MPVYETKQENLWAGRFGAEYAGRNRRDEWIASSASLFARSLSCCGPIQNCVEFGANIGLNLRALRFLFPNIALRAVEINAQAAEELRRSLPDCDVRVASMLDLDPAGEPPADLVLSKGVLIHVAPDSLGKAYRLLTATARRYLLICEYYNPTPVSVEYRGHSESLFKRDFCGEILDSYPAFRLKDYGFVYRRDPNFPQDDVNWFLLERR